MQISMPFSYTDMLPFPPACSVDAVARWPCDPSDGLSGGDQPLVDTGEPPAAGVMGG